jgi:3',5'-cyclic-AMP phosphodiesterase
MAEVRPPDPRPVRFVQISDSHTGFDKAANPDVTATLREAITKIKTLPEAPSFLLHTGDLTHLSKPQEFDTLQQVLSELSQPIFYVPGEHDMLVDDGRAFSIDSAAAHRAPAGTASTKMACTSSAS